MPGRLSCRQLSIVFLFLVWAASALPAAPATPTASHTVPYETTRQDEDRTDKSLQTFNALFPKGAYFGVIALIGPANHIDLQPSFDLRLIKRWILITEAGFFWRQSIHDGIYGPAINLLRSAGSSTSRFIGSQIATQAEWEINPHFSWTGNYTHFHGPISPGYRAFEGRELLHHGACSRF